MNGMTSAGCCGAMLVAALAAALPCAAAAQGAAGFFPAKPVRVVVPQATGGATDIQARLFAARMSQNLGQQFIVDNRVGGGAAGVVALTTVARAAPDGYTLLAVVPSFTFSPALYKNYPVDPIKDFAPVSWMTRAPYLLVVNASSPAKSVKDFIAYARAQPEGLFFGAGNMGSGTHLVTLWFLSAANVKAAYVPYRSVGLAMLDLTAGRIDATLANVLSAVSHVKAGKLRALGISTAPRSRVLPDLPTIAEQGVPGYDASTFHGYAAPAGTPAAIVDKLSAEFARVVKSPEVAERLSDDGGEPIGSTPHEFRQFIASEILVWRKVVMGTGMRVE
jgi:tripartite-type tricarboxylate transporter receptor subunit TctC